MAEIRKALYVGKERWSSVAWLANDRLSPDLGEAALMWKPPGGITWLGKGKWQDVFKQWRAP